MKYTTTDGNKNNNDATKFANAKKANTGLFCEEVDIITNIFDKWNECERTVVIYALLKRLHYPSLKFLQCSIDNNLLQNLGSQLHFNSTVIDMNANNASYLQDILTTYKFSDVVDLSEKYLTISSDKDSFACLGRNYRLSYSDERKVFCKKQEILVEILHMLPLLKPGNDEAKHIYLTIIPIAVKDAMRQYVSSDIVQQIFSYLLIHPAITAEDRRSLSIWLRYLEEHIQLPMYDEQVADQCKKLKNGCVNINIENAAMSTSGSSVSSSLSSSSASCSISSNASISSSIGNLLPITSPSGTLKRNTDWQTIAPPSKHHQLQSNTRQNWTTVSKLKQYDNLGNELLCDKLNGITINKFISSQNPLGLTIGSSMINSSTDDSTLVSGVVAAASATTNSNNFDTNLSPMMDIANGSNGTKNNLNNDDNDNSFSKNGTEIIDFEPQLNSQIKSCEACYSSNEINRFKSQHDFQIFDNMNVGICGEIDSTRWNLDNKQAAHKTRRSNSLTTQTLSSTSSSNSSVITINDNYSNSIENLSQFMNKPRSFSLSIEHQRSAMTDSGSDTRLDDYKPNYIKFQTKNVGMGNIGIWLKSLRLHKYIDLFKNITYEEMFRITEEYLQGLGVTKGASHKLALCIEKLCDRSKQLIKMEEDLLRGITNMQTIIEELANIVLTPMKPLELVNGNSGEDNIALRFLKILDLVCSIIHKDQNPGQDEDYINMIMWILDRSIHSEAFINHGNQLKELKFKLSKFRISLGQKIHQNKSSSSVNLYKPRWNNKGRKCESKNGSSDRINFRKNSNELSFPLCSIQKKNSLNQQQKCDFDKYKFYYGINNNTNQNPHYKNSPIPSFSNNQHFQNNFQKTCQVAKPSNFPNLSQRQNQSAIQCQRLSPKTLNIVSDIQNLSNKDLQSNKLVADSTNFTCEYQERPLNCKEQNTSAIPIKGNTSVNFTSITCSDISDEGQHQLNQSLQEKAMSSAMENLTKFDQHFSLF